MKKKYQRIADNINQKATAMNTDELLSDYMNRRLIASRANLLRSPANDGMPSSPDPHLIERNLIDRMDARDFVSACDSTLETVKQSRSPELAELLKLLYFRSGFNNETIAVQLGVEHSAYYERKRKALVAFALAFPNRWGELIVYKQPDGR